MAREREKQEPETRQQIPDRVLVLASQLYAQMVLAGTGKTSEHIAEAALDKAAIFWATVDKRERRNS